MHGTERKGRAIGAPATLWLLSLAAVAMPATAGAALPSPVSTGARGGYASPPASRRSEQPFTDRGDLERDRRLQVERGEQALLLATLTPQGGATSNGSGSAALTLAADGETAWLRYDYDGLSGQLTAAHVHGPGGQILFDLDTAPPPVDGALLWTIVAAGTFDTEAILEALRGGQCYLNLHTAAYPTGEILGYLRRSNGSQTFTAPPPPPPLSTNPPTAQEAARFLLQATFGPRPEEIAEVQEVGYAAWIDRQLALPPSGSHLAYYDALAVPGEDPPRGLVQESIYARAIGGDDQLRQRVALALSELFVVSDRDTDVRNFPDGLADYADLLAERAFGNYRDLLEAVTLHPTMGVYLDMLGSSRELPELDRLPNENYAREVLQLFSIGLYRLHPDGSLALDGANRPIPTYDQAVVLGFARAFTGWSFGGLSQTEPALFFRPRGGRNFRRPMEPWPLFHEDGEKLLLDGRTLPAGLGARTDLETALQNVFEHPNVGPFVCRRLIQRLVTSNPSPAYVYRCAQAFADDGQGVRGDLGAVVRTILLDYEARSRTLADRQDYGHLREPVVRFAGMLRTLHAETPEGRWRFAQIDRPGIGLGEVPLRSPTVFNFFEPDYAQPGEIATAGLVSPELQISTETTTVGAANLHYATLVQNGDRLRLDLSPLLAPVAVTDEELLDQVELLFFGGSMGAGTREVLGDALADPAFPTAPAARALRLLWLVGLSPEHAVQR